MRALRFASIACIATVLFAGAVLNAQTAGPCTPTSPAPCQLPVINLANIQFGTITVTYQDSLGVSDIEALDLYITAGNPAQGAANSCAITLQRNTNTLFLVNDPGTAFLPFGIPASVAGQPPVPGLREANSQCLIRSDDGTVVTQLNSTTLQLTISINLQGSTLSGTNVGVWQDAEDGRGLRGVVQQEASITPVPTTPPPVCHPIALCSVTATPANALNTNFTATYYNGNDPGGPADIQVVDLYITNVAPASTPNATVNVCVIQYRPHVAPPTLFVLNNAGTAFVSQPAQNSQCTANSVSSFISGNSLVVTFNVTFQPSFAGTKNLYVDGFNGLSNVAGSTWQTLLGTYFVP